MLVAVARPRLRGRSRADWLTVLAFGLTLGSMNWAIYQSFARIPLGLAVTIEFVGPLTLAVVMCRRPRDLLWVGAGGGRGRPARVREDRAGPGGVAFALVAGGALGGVHPPERADRPRWPGLDGLAMASVVATAS